MYGALYVVGIPCCELTLGQVGDYASLKIVLRRSSSSSYPPHPYLLPALSLQDFGSNPRRDLCEGPKFRCRVLIIELNLSRKPSIEPYKKQTNIHHQQSVEGTRP